MLKKYEVEAIIKNALLDMDGVISDKPNEDGTYDLYFVNVFIDDDSNIIFTFDTYNRGKRIERDRYKIKAEYME